MTPCSPFATAIAPFYAQVIRRSLRLAHKQLLLSSSLTATSTHPALTSCTTLDNISQASPSSTFLLKLYNICNTLLYESHIGFRSIKGVRRVSNISSPQQGCVLPSESRVTKYPSLLFAWPCPFVVLCILVPFHYKKTPQNTCYRLNSSLPPQARGQHSKPLLFDGDMNHWN